MKDLLTPRQRKLLRKAQAELRRKRGGRCNSLTPARYEAEYTAEVEKRRRYRSTILLNPSTVDDDLLVNDGTLI